MEKNEKIDGTYGEIWVEISQPVFFSMRKRIVFNRKWNEFASHRHLRLCTVVTSINHASHTDQKHKNKDGKLRIILDAKKATAAWNVCSINPWGIVKKDARIF